MFFALVSAGTVSSVDEAIGLYEMGDISGAIVALERVLEEGSLSFDEQLRAWDRLGSSYFAVGDTAAAAAAYKELLKVDVYYDLSPRANPRLQAFLDDVRDATMSSAMVRTDPPGAIVTLDGQVMGVSPIMLNGLIGGDEYQIDVYQIGYNTEHYALEAQPGHSHLLQFVLEVLPDQTGAAVAMADTPSDLETEQFPVGTLRDDELVSSPLESPGNSSLTPDEMVASPLAGNQSSGNGQVASTEPTAASVSPPPHQPQPSSEQPSSGVPQQSSPPQTTADLLAMLSGNTGIDMASINNGGTLTSGSSETLGLAGSTGGRAGVSSSGVAAQAEGFGEDIMVFSDISEFSSSTASGAEDYSSRTADEIAELVAAKRGSIMYIYNKHLRNDPLLMGRVEVSLVIHPSGRVSNVQIVSSTMYNQAFELELMRSIEEWRFGSVSENEGPLTIQLPFNFSP